MIKRVTHATLYVKDQNEALRFYTECLGFELRADRTIGDFRWLTVSPKQQPEFEIILYPIKADGFMLSEDDARSIAMLVEKGKLGGPVVKSDDVRKAYAEMTAKGVEFLNPPTDQPWGVEAVFKDNSGNVFSLQQEV